MHFLVLTFLPHFCFDPYFSILLLLVLKIKNAFYFSPYRHLTNENILCDKRNA